MQRRRLSLRRRGFTILEIMIATAILTLGLVGILALFPVAIDSAKKIMDRSTAVTIAKSVSEAIRSAIRNQKRTFFIQEEPCTYFVFRHDGVKDPIPRDRALERATGDYFILLPHYSQRMQPFSQATDQARREAAVAASKEFVYPETDEPRNGGGDPFRAHDDGKDGPGGKGIVVKKVYEIGSFFPSDDSSSSEVDGPGKTRPVSAGDDLITEDQRNDPFKQYSFAFSIRASEFDTNVMPVTAGNAYKPGNNLYHIRLMIFRAFTFNEEQYRDDGKWPDPVYEMDFEVAK